MMTRHPIFLATLAFAATFCISQSVQAQGKTAKPCTLLTDAQIKAALGTPTLPGKPTFSADKAECTWADATGATRVYLSIKPAGIEYKAFRDQMQATGRMVPVTGLAEDAFYIASSGSSAALYALKAKQLILLTVDGVKASRAENEASERGLVSQLLPKL